MISLHDGNVAAGVINLSIALLHIDDEGLLVSDLYVGALPAHYVPSLSLLFDE